MSLTVNDLNAQHNNKTRNIAEVNVPCIASDAHIASLSHLAIGAAMSCYAILPSHRHRWLFCFYATRVRVLDRIVAVNPTENAILSTWLLGYLVGVSDGRRVIINLGSGDAGRDAGYSLACHLYSNQEERL